MMQCACGCGLEPPLATRNRAERGQVKGQPVKWLPGHQAIKHGRYRGCRGKAAHVLARYGLTPEDHEALRVKQKGLCAICHEPRRLVVDHDHATGKVRGLLCHRCNILLEWAERYDADRHAYIGAANS